MISITQDLKFKQTVVEYSFKHGVTAAMDILLAQAV